MITVMMVIKRANLVKMIKTGKYRVGILGIRGIVL